MMTDSQVESSPSEEPTTLRSDPAPRSSLRALGAAIREFVVVIVMALALSFVVKTWLVQAFFIPSGSMEDTLITGDRVVVNKLVPDLVDLKRGDVVVFEDPGQWLSNLPVEDRGMLGSAVSDVLTFVGLLPAESQNHLIKRVIGMPGDQVACCGSEGRITVNGTELDESYLKPGGRTDGMEFNITVPQGRVWVMGDNRDHSEDSRFHDPAGDGSEGSVPIEKITGRAFIKVWPPGRMGMIPGGTDALADVPAAQNREETPTPSGTAAPR